MACGNDYLVVAAIDFGTTFSGYAFSMYHEYQSDPTKCSTFTWTAGSGGLQSLKSSTCVLFDKHKKFAAFGFEAEDKYSDLALENEHHNWYFFRRFKMQLYKQIGLKRDFKLEADNGKTMPAMTVFAAVIEHLKNHLVSKCQQQQTTLDEEDILFVLTVPAIWTDPAKQFMREAAIEAGIDGNRLVMSLEPEAASLFCKHVPVERMVDGSEAGGFSAFQPGSKYIVVDAGGGTIDITVHVVQNNGNLREIHKANGGDWGGTKVDEAFRALLCDIVGEKVMGDFCKNNKYDMLELFRDFEVKKRTITPETKDKMTFKVPISLNETFQKYNKKKNIKDVLPKMEKYKGKVAWLGDKMRLDANLAKGLFSESIGHIVDHLEELAENDDVDEAQYILMVGGYSESPMLRNAVMQAFPDKKIVVPCEAGLSVLKGATIFGHEPRTIEFRVCKYTYGVETSHDFDPDIHEEDYLYTTSTGEELCGKLFSKHVEIGDTIEVGTPQREESYSVTEPDQERMTFRIFISEDEDPMYVTDDSCTHLGSMTIDVPGYGLGRSVTACMTFSDTEVHVEATDDQNGETTTACFDLLN